MVEYFEADRDVLHIAQELIPVYHPHLRECAIGFIFRSEAAKSKGKIVASRTSKTPEKIKPLLSEEVDFVIEIARDSWSGMDSSRRVALIDHELCHIGLNEKGDLALVAHDFEEFTAIIKRHGMWTYALIHAGEAMKRATQAVQLMMPVDEESHGKLVALKGVSAEAATGLGEDAET